MHAFHKRWTGLARLKEYGLLAHYCYSRRRFVCTDSVLQFV